MKIAGMDVVIYDRKMAGNADQFRIKSQSLHPLLNEGMAIRLWTDDGVEGFSFGLKFGKGLANYIASAFKPWLIGRDCGDREAIWHDAWTLDRLWVLPQFAQGTVDVAIWDLYGKSIGRPVHEILGTYRTAIPTYASSMTKQHADEYVDEALKFQSMGYRGYKLHVVGQVDTDIEVCQRVRDAVGDGYPLMVDAVSSYTFEEALKVGRALEELDYKWFEEPLRDFLIGRYRELTRQLDIPILGIEVIPGGIYSRAEYIMSNAVDIARADVSYVGGVGPTKKMAALAEAFGMKLEIHTNANPFMDAANLHVAASIQNTDFFEQLVPVELFGSDFVPPVVIEYGMAQVGDAPGFGVEVDWEGVRKNALATL